MQKIAHLSEKGYRVSWKADGVRCVLAFLGMCVHVHVHVHCTSTCTYVNVLCVNAAIALCVYYMCA